MSRECDMWDAGVLIAESWHRKEQIRKMTTAAEMIDAGESSGAWPIAIDLMEMTVGGGLIVPGKAVVATYRPGSRKPWVDRQGNPLPGANLVGDRLVHGAVGDRYKNLNPKEWRAMCEAAVLAGAKPAGAFSLFDGSRALATFEIPQGDQSNLPAGSRIASFINLMDAFDGSAGFCVGGSDIRVVCRNTMRGWLSERGHVSIRHTASIDALAEQLRKTMEEHLKGGGKLRELYATAKETKLQTDDAQKLFDELFPPATPEQIAEAKEKKGGAQATVTKIERERKEARDAMKNPMNFEGKGSLATLWNGATYVVTHKPDGSMRDGRGGSEMLDSLLAGSMAQRIQQIQKKIEVILRDGKTVEMTATEAARAGLAHDPKVGGTLLDEMLNIN